MQYVVPFIGGPLGGKQTIWTKPVVTYGGHVYTSVYNGSGEIPLKYICEETKELTLYDIKPAPKSFLAPYQLVIPDAIYELEPASQCKIHIQLQAFVNSAVAKYVAGQKEHGGKLEDRPCFDEMHNEILDLMWYWYAEKERRQKALFDE